MYPRKGKTGIFDKGSLQDETFFLFIIKKEYSEKGQDGRFKWQTSSVEGNKVSMWTVASEKRWLLQNTREIFWKMRGKFKENICMLKSPLNYLFLYKNALV